MDLSFKSGAVTAVVMGGAITAVAAIITVGAEAAVTTMVGGIIAIGGDIISANSGRPPSVRWGRVAATFSEKSAGVNRRAPIFSLSGCD